MSTIVITTADIALYRRCNGDLDGLARAGHQNADRLDAVWRVIDDLRQRTFILASGIGSDVFVQRLDADIVAFMPDAQVRSELRQLVEADLSVTAYRVGR